MYISSYDEGYEYLFWAMNLLSCPVSQPYLKEIQRGQYTCIYHVICLLYFVWVVQRHHQCHIPHTALLHDAGIDQITITHSIGEHVMYGIMVHSATSYPVTLQVSRPHFHTYTYIYMYIAFSHKCLLHAVVFLRLETTLIHMYIYVYVDTNAVPPSIRIYPYFIRNCARKYGIRRKRSNIRIWILVT